MLVLMAFGALLPPPVLGNWTPAHLVHAIRPLTVVRTVPVALCLARTGPRRPSVLSLVWFGSRGIAAIVYVLVLGTLTLPPDAKAGPAAVHATVLLPIMVHEASAGPLAGRHGAWSRETSIDHAGETR